MINLYQILKTSPDFSRQLTCGDLLLTHIDCPQTVRKERFYLQHNLIVYVIRGRRIVHRNRKTHDLSEGVCAFIKKGTYIAEKEENEGWCEMAFLIPDSFLKQLVEENYRNLPLTNLPEAPEDDILELEINDLTRSFFSSMMPYFTQTPPPPENLIELKFKELILSMLFSKKNNRLLSYFNWLRDNKYPTVEEVMHKNFTFNLTLPEFATLACRSVPTFQREFRKIFGTTPARWIMKKRLKLATELLENTPMSIGEITFECGFENQTHFSRVFKEYMGLSPSRYRMECQAVATGIHS
jgi:AraC-like DNA-binding protein